MAVRIFQGNYNDKPATNIFLACGGVLRASIRIYKTGITTLTNLKINDTHLVVYATCVDLCTFLVLPSYLPIQIYIGT